MKTLIITILSILISAKLVFTQGIKETGNTKSFDVQTSNTKLDDTDSITVTDNEGNTLLSITDEGTAGAITLWSLGDNLIGNKLYNFGGNLFWGNSQLGTTANAGGWMNIGNSIYTSNLSDRVGIGIVNPLSKLDVFGAVKISADSNLPASTNNGLYMAGNYNDIDIGRIYVGNDTGWKFHFSNRINNTDKDLMTIKDNGNIGVGTVNPAESAILDLYSNSRGLLLPRLSFSQIQSITNAVEGLIVYNTTDNVLVYYNGTEWINPSCSITPPTFPPNCVFVSTTGIDDPSAGTKENPFKTISYAIQEAHYIGYTNVVVSNGVYNETVTIYTGISLYGGYDTETWERNIEHSQTIIHGTDLMAGSHSVTLICNNITETTLIEGFVIYGANNYQPSGNSYAIYINNCNSNLQFRNNIIFCGNGGNGNNGSNGQDGMLGLNGVGRDQNPSLYDAFIAQGSGLCNPSNNRQYNNGGQLIVDGSNISGGNGGGNICPPQYGTQNSAIDGFPGRTGNGLGDGPGGSGGDEGLSCPEIGLQKRKETLWKDKKSYAITTVQLLSKK